MSGPQAVKEWSWYFRIHSDAKYLDPTTLTQLAKLIKHICVEEVVGLYFSSMLTKKGNSYYVLTEIRRINAPVLPKNKNCAHC